MGFADVPRLSILPPLTIDLVPTPVLVAVPTNTVAKLQVRKVALLAGVLSAAGDPGVTV